MNSVHHNFPEPKVSSSHVLFKTQRYSVHCCRRLIKSHFEKQDFWLFCFKKNDVNNQYIVKIVADVFPLNQFIVSSSEFTSYNHSYSVGGQNDIFLD